MSSSHVDRVPFVDLHAQYLTIQPEIDDALQSVIRESAYVRGRHVETFERDWASHMGMKHCVSCANGTDALYIAMRGLGLKPGDEVITTAHSWISTSETITQAGGRVVFCDTDHTFTIDPAQIESRISSRTVGIIPVHLYGQPADMDPILAVARKHNLWIWKIAPRRTWPATTDAWWERSDKQPPFPFIRARTLAPMEMPAASSRTTTNWQTG
jgi:dTDP-4-amino-4,6-dideoxygalactose transaminase